MIRKDILKKSWKEFLGKFIITIVVRGSLLAIPLLLSMVVDYVTAGNYSSAYLIAVVLLLVLIIFRVTEILNTYSWHKLYNKLYNLYSLLAIEKTYDNSIYSLSRFSLSEYINIMNNDINVIATFYCNLSVRIFRIFELIVIIGYFFKIGLLNGVASVVATIISFIIIILSSKKIENRSQIRTISLDQKTSVMHEMLLGIKEIKALNIFNPIKNRIMDKTDIYTNDWLKQRMTEDKFRGVNLLLIEVFRMTLMIYAIYLISIGKSQLGSLLVIYNYFGQLLDNIADFSAINNELRSLSVSQKRYNKLLEFSKRETDKVSLISKDIDPSITFKDILYGNKENPILNKVSFNIKSNSLVAITGQNGSGKSGIFDLLLKLNRQHEGDVLIGNSNINEFSNDEYSYLVSSVFKDVVFFGMSIKDNLSIIDKNFEKIIDVCKRLDIHDYILNLKDGYDTILNTNGSNIDSNVKYLLGIARVILKETKIILFDETLNNLDNLTKEDVINLLLELKLDHTILVITKDSNLLKKADDIIYLENNKVKNQGKHNKLLKEEKKYKDNFI